MEKTKKVRTRQVTLARKGSKSDLLVLRVVSDPTKQAIRTLKVMKGDWPGSRMALTCVKKVKKSDWPGSRMVPAPTTTVIRTMKGVNRSSMFLRK